MNHLPLILLADLVCYGTGGFASGLAGCLTFAAPDLLVLVFEVTRKDGFDMFHNESTLFIVI
jgi:hypothetical protein